MQITSDGLRVYLEAVESAFAMDVDFAVLQKIYGAESAAERSGTAQPRSSAARRRLAQGNPDPKHISTQLRRASKLERPGQACAVTRACRTASAGRLVNHAAAVSLNHFVITSSASIERLE